METVLVTGACGLIGERVCSGLLKKDCAVIAVDTKKSLYNEGKSNYLYVEGGVDDKSKIAKLFEEHNVKVLIHLACTVDNDFGPIVTEKEIEISKKFDKFIYRYAFAAGIRKIVTISTSQVYKTIQSREPIREDDEVKIVSNYAFLKYESEKSFVEEIRTKKDAICCICRVAPVYTKDFHDNLSSKITDPKDGTNFVIGGGQYGFQFCCVHNLVDFILCFVKNADDVKYTGIYNVSDKLLVKASDIIVYMKANGHKLGAVLQRSSTGGIAGIFKKLSGNKEEKTNYRYLDLSTINNNNMLDNNRAAKLTSFRWNVQNTK